MRIATWLGPLLITFALGCGGDEDDAPLIPPGDEPARLLRTVPDGLVLYREGVLETYASSGESLSSFAMPASRYVVQRVRGFDVNPDHAYWIDDDGALVRSRHDGTELIRPAVTAPPGALIADADGARWIEIAGEDEAYLVTLPGTDTEASRVALTYDTAPEHEPTVLAPIPTARAMAVDTERATVIVTTLHGPAEHAYVYSVNLADGEASLLLEVGAEEGVWRDEVDDVVQGVNGVYIVQARYDWASVVADTVTLRRLGDDATVTIEGLPRDRIVASNGQLMWNSGDDVYAMTEASLATPRALTDYPWGSILGFSADAEWLYYSTARGVFRAPLP